MNELSIKLQQTFQQRKTNQRFSEVLNTQKHPSMLPPPKINAIPTNSFNPSSLPNITHQKISITAIKTQKRKSQSMKKLSVDQQIHSLAQPVYEKKQAVYLDTKKRSNSSHKVRALSSQKVHSFRLLPKNNTQQKILLQNKFVTPSKQKATQQITTGIQGTKIKQSTTKIKQKIQILLKQDKSKKGKNIKKFDDLLNNLTQDLFLNVKERTIQQNGSFKLFVNSFKGDDGTKLLQNLRRFIRRYKIQRGTVEGKKLLAISSKKVFSNYQLLCCFNNKNQIIKNTKIIGLNFYQPSKSRGIYLAAARIQSLFRMIRSQKYTIQLRSVMKKVIIIQRKWRHSLLIKHTKKNIMANINKKIQHYHEIQKKFVEQWEIIRTSPRIQIHIGAICAEQFKRLTIDHIQHCQNTQITRIFRSIETDTTIIYISSITISQEVQRYYERLFNLHSQTYKAKLYILTPQNIQRLPNHLSLASQLLYSPKTLLRIKKILGLNNSYAYIVPSYPSIQYTNLSSELNVPLMSSSPTALKLYSTKSFCRKIFEKCSFPKLKSMHGIYSEKQLINSLAILFYRHPEVKRWYLKIQDDIRSRGLAIINSQNFPFLRQLRRQESLEEVQAQKQIIKLIAEELKAKLMKKLKILNRDVYSNYQQYISHFVTRGGIIEAQPAEKAQQFSISFFIEPNGDFRILGTYHKLQLGGKQLPGAIMFPASVGNQNTFNLSNFCERTVRSLYKTLYLHFKQYGYFTIDMLYVEQQKNVYPIGLDCFLNEQTSSIFGGTYCSQSSYHKDSNNLIRRETIGGGSCSYIYCPLIRIPGLPHLSNFFKKCKFGNISFDIKEKLGFVFILLDDLQSNVLGFYCIEKDKQALLENLRNSTEYLNKEFSSNKGSKKDDLGFLKGISVVWSRKNKVKETNVVPNLSSLF